ncbi:MAG: uracil-DNA glycosylase [Candidatus Hodarchaeales archaeon]
MASIELSRLERDCYNCMRCELYKSRTKTVFGEGPSPADILLIGEAPGKEEDLTGRPFVGKAGKILDDILEMTGLKRESLYITSVLKCRPPGNRKPLDHEIIACQVFINNQIRIIQPRIIVLMGNTAIKTFTGLEGVKKLHGSVRNIGTDKFFITYHPAAVIYSKEIKKELIADFKTVNELINC